MLPNELIIRLSQLYKLDFDPKNIIKVTAGSMSHNYILIADQTQYFLKQHRDDDLAILKKINLAEQFFSNHQIPVILPLADNEANKFILYENKYYSLYPYIKAKQYSRAELPESTIPSLATTLAKMHLIGQGQILTGFEVTPPSKPDLSKLDNFNQIENIIRQQNQLSDFDKLALESLALKKKLATEFLNQPPATLPADTLIHGDYQEANIFFDEHGQVSHIFDFEKVRYSARAYEIVRAIEYIFLNNGYTPQYIDRARLFLTKYQEIYPIDQQEIAIAYRRHFLSAIFTDWIERDHYILNNHRVDQFLPFQLQSINYLHQNFDKHLADITK